MGVKYRPGQRVNTKPSNLPPGTERAWMNSDNAIIVYLTAIWPLVLAYMVAFKYRKPGISKLQLFLSGSTLLLASSRYLTATGLKLFWLLIAFWFVWAIWLAAR